MIRFSSTHLDRMRQHMRTAADEMWSASVERANCKVDGDAAGEAVATERIHEADRRLVTEVFRYLMALGAS